MASVTPTASLLALDPPTRALARASAAFTAGTESVVRVHCDELLAAEVPPVWVDELILQSYLFAGFPRALNAAREWRKRAPRPSAAVAIASGDARAAGEATCAIVYGPYYDKLRINIRALHPTLDDWMIEEGYGKVLSRPGLDLARRELCIVAACAAAAQERQLHSHLHGARHAGVAPAVIDELLAALDGVVAADSLVSATHLWERVRGK